MTNLTRETHPNLFCSVKYFVKEIRLHSQSQTEVNGKPAVMDAEIIHKSASGKPFILVALFEKGNNENTVLKGVRSPSFPCFGWKSRRSGWICRCRGALSPRSTPKRVSKMRSTSTISFRRLGALRDLVLAHISHGCTNRWHVPVHCMAANI